MAVTWAWCGAVSPTSALVVGKVAGSTRLAVSTSPDLTDLTYFGPFTPSAQGVVRIEPTGLSPSTRYHWALEDGGVLDLDWQGQFATQSSLGQPATYTYAVGSCAGLTGSDPGGNDHIASGVSNRPVFANILDHLPDFFVDQGDLHYRNIATADVSLYRTAYQDVLTYNGTLGASARQGQLYRNVPMVYQWDDHCYGANNSDRTSVSKLQAAQAYREIVPHYPLAQGASEGVYHSFRRGRILHVLLDDRFYRSPNSDPDGASKTMLGETQKAWLRNLLDSTDAEYLIVFSQVDWLRPVAAGADNWGGFSVERDEVRGIFADTGFLGRMHMHIGDRHTMGMCSGATNDWGGFPVYMYGALDSNPGVSTDSRYDLGITGGRDRYGLVTVEDQGDQIVVTNRGYIGSSLWQTHQHVVAATPVEPPTPPPPPVADAAPRESITWLGCDLVSGTIIDELPDMDAGEISRVLGAYTSHELTMPIPLAGPGTRLRWEAATAPRDTMLVPVINDVPSWGGIILRRQGGTEATLRLACVTPEGYLDRRYVGNHGWTANDEVGTIAAGLIGDANVEGINLILDAPATGVLRHRVYFDKDDVTVYAALRELMSVQGGPEWTIDLDWADASQTAVSKIVRVGPRIGAASSNPAAVFDSRGESDTTYVYTEGWADEDGANHVIATGTGQGEDRPQSSPAFDVPAGKARWEHRFSPPGTVPDPTQLTAHAVAQLARMVNGSKTWEIDTRWDAEPRLNVHWRLGDDTAFDLIGHRHPGGVTGTGRVIGWKLNKAAGRVVPILLEITADSRPIDEEKLLKSGSVTAKPNSQGYINNVAHNAGFTPANIICQGAAPITGSGKPMGILRDQITATDFRIRALNASGSPITTEVTIDFTSFEG